MQAKCSLTHEECRIAFDYGKDACKDSCPIEQYKDSSYYYGPGESKTGAQCRIDNTCRFYGLKRAQEIRNRNFMEG